MADKKEVKKLMKYAKKIVSKSSYKKLKTIEDIDEKKQAVIYSIKASLERDHDILRKVAKKMKKSGKDVFFAEAKLSLLSGKIKLFNATHHKNDFNSMKKLFNQIEKELANV